MSAPQPFHRGPSNRWGNPSGLCAHLEMLAESGGAGCCAFAASGKAAMPAMIAMRYRQRIGPCPAVHHTSEEGLSFIAFLDSLLPGRPRARTPTQCGCAAGQSRSVRNPVENAAQMAMKATRYQPKPWLFDENAS